MAAPATSSPWDALMSYLPRLTSFEMHWATNALLVLVAFFTFRVLRIFYLWNFVWLRGMPGPKSPSFFYGHIPKTLLSECNSLWHKWEEE